MNKETIYSKLRKICWGRWCSECPIKSINPDHKCGNGYGYFFRWKYGTIIRSVEVLLYHVWGRKSEGSYREKKGER